MYAGGPDLDFAVYIQSTVSVMSTKLEKEEFQKVLAARAWPSLLGLRLGT